MWTKLAVVGVPSSAGAHHPGQEMTPQALRRAGLIERLMTAVPEVIDLGDLPTVCFSPDAGNPKQQNLDLVCHVAKLTGERVSQALASGAKFLVIGGDCTITLGVLAAMQEYSARIGLLYFDGDIDLNTPEDSPSGIFDGMGIAHILGKGAPELTHMGPRFPLLDEKEIVLFGYNPESGWMDPAEFERLEQSALKRYAVREIRGRAHDAAAEAIRILEEKADHIFVHFDVDVIDAAELPAADVPHSGGLSFRDAAEALRVFLASPKTGGLVVTEFNAARDGDGSQIHRLLTELVGAI
jgi:arginase